jgi:hypothetical protein
MSGVARAESRFNQFRNPGPCVAARIALTSNGEQRRELRRHFCLIRKSVKRFSEKIMRKQRPEARWQIQSDLVACRD